MGIVLRYMRMRVFVTLCAVAFCGSAFAQDLVSPVPLPMPRPENRNVAAPSFTPPPPPVRIEDSEDETPEKPARIYQAACPAMLSGLVEGKMLPPLEEGACGLQSPIEVSAVFVGGQKVEFTSPITTNCQMATTLAGWVGQVSDYTQSIFNAPVTGLVTGTSYMCRPRNNQAGADQSEHGFANALDVVGFEIGGKRRVSLPENWDPATPEGRTMRFAHDAACGQFTTVLGPEANALHFDHLHVDLGCHGKTCTYRLCE